MMTKSAMVRARMDPNLKEEAEAILQELGLSTTQAMTLFFQQIRLKKGIPFDVRLPNKQNGRSEVEAELPSEPSLSVDPRRPIMLKNVAAYKAMHSELVEKYLGQYVAIYEEKLVDHDADPEALIQRILIKYPYPNQVVMRRKVELVPEPEFRVRHPRIEKVL